MRLLFLIFLPFISISQEIIRENIGSTGTTNKIENIHFRQSIGQSSASTGVVYNNGIILRQGFQQPILQINKIKPLNGEELDVLVYPNPFRSDINITFPKIPSGKVHISIYDVKGKIIKNIDYLSLKELKIPLQDLAKGSYLLNINNSNKNYNANLIKN